MAARFVGEVDTRWRGERLMELLAPFGFVDEAGVEWPVPQGVLIDGSSIPDWLWGPALGGPFEGAHRAASVIHDYYCDVRTRSWQAVHKVFYEAMVAAGEDRLRAKAMYAGVRALGPKWNLAASHNTLLFGGVDPPPLAPTPESDPASPAPAGDGGGGLGGGGVGFDVDLSRFDKGIFDNVIAGRDVPGLGAGGDLLSGLDPEGAGLDFEKTRALILSTAPRTMLAALQKEVIASDPPLDKIESWADRVGQTVSWNAPRAGVGPFRSGEGFLER